MMPAERSVIFNASNASNQIVKRHNSAPRLDDTSRSQLLACILRTIVDPPSTNAAPGDLSSYSSDPCPVDCPSERGIGDRIVARTISRDLNVSLTGKVVVPATRWDALDHEAHIAAIPKRAAERRDPNVAAQS